MDRRAKYLYKSNMKARPDHHRILNFNLFGEAADMPDVVHCETISARSRLHEWEFAPHRHARLHQVLLVAEGGGTARLEGRAEPLRPMTLVNVPVGDVHGFSFQPGTEGWVVTFAAEMLDEAFLPGEGVGAALAACFALPAGAQATRVMEAIFAEHAGRGFGRAQMLRALGLQLLTLTARVAMEAGEGEGEGNAPSRQAELLARFGDLLESHFRDHWGVEDYARALAITPTHLTRLARGATGRPASRLIEERLVREARRNLFFTNLPVTAIAYDLGFADPAYFSRVFARVTGVSPSGFRERAGV